MNKLIGLYIILIFLIALIILFNVNLYPAFLMHVTFNAFLHKFFEILMTFIYFLIFLKANKLYSQTQDKRLAIIAGSFLAGIYLNVYHLLSTFSYFHNTLSLESIKINKILIYFMMEKLVISISIFIAVFYTPKSPSKAPEKFKNKIYFIYFCIFLIIIIADQFVFYFLSKNIFHKVLLLNHSLSVLDESIYFLTAFIWADRISFNNKKMISNFILGLFFIGISELFLINQTFLEINEIISYLFKLVGFLLIFFGLKDIQLLSDGKNLKQRLLIFLTFFFIILYSTFSFLHSLMLENYLSAKFLYIYIEFLLIFVIIGYISATKFISPLSNIIQVINKYEPGEKSEKILITSNDEVGELSKKLNEMIDREWVYSQELLINQKKVQELLNKEKLLFKITNTIRSSLDIDETLSIIGDEIAKIFNVERTTIVEIPEKNNYKKWIARKEFKSNEKIKGLSNIQYDIRVGEYNGIFVLDKGQNLIIKNIQESDLPDYYKKTYEEMGIKSVLSVPIMGNGDKWGLIFLSEYEYYREWKEEEINLLQTIAKQIYIAIKQAELCTSAKKQAERESILRNISNKIRSSLDLEEVKHEIVNQIGQLLKADRVTIAYYDYQKENYIVSKESEYRSSENIKTFIDQDFKNIPGFIEFIRDVHLKGKDIIFNDLEKYLDENNLRGTGVEKFYRDFGFISSAAINIYYRDLFLGDLVITFENQRNIHEEELSLIKILADQSGIAIYQSELYNKEKLTARRESILRDIIGAMRGTLDINEIKTLFVNSIGQFFKADRVFFSEFNAQKNMYKPVDNYSEYLSSPQEKSFIGYDWTNPEIIEYIQPLIEKQEINIYNLDEYLAKNSKSNAFIRLFKDSGVQSSYNLPVLYLDELIGYFCIEFTKREYRISEEELGFIRNIISQASIALNQAKVFETIKKQAENEKILREILSEIKISETLDEVYDYIIKKLSNIFDTQRAFFIEVPELQNDKPTIKYQYNKQLDTPFIPDYMIQEKCLIALVKIANKEGVAIINNTEEHNKDDEKLQNFFKTYDIKSILLTPLIRYNHDIKQLGAIILCMNNVKDWDKDEIALIKSITNITTNVIWEIKKRVELEELRNVFILTLTHDLQVPLVGEHKALEFVISRPFDQPIGKFQSIITDILISNENLTALLKKLLFSYNYESGKQKLNLSLQDLNIQIDEVIASFKILIDSKQISIETQIEENLPSIMIDSEQIKNVLHTIIENSLNYIQQGGHIIIKSTKQDDKIITCIIDNGPGIPYRMRERLFERYAMALAVERKIGAGLGLYLAKQIIEAHNGKIWYETEIGKGTTFCFSLPCE